MRKAFVMAIECRSGVDAWKVAAKNKLARYPTPEDGSERLFPLASPEARPTFSISKESKIFTIGSCFARDVDHALNSAGFNVISRGDHLKEVLSLGFEWDRIFYKYTAPSILNELRWTIDKSHPGEAAFMELSPGKWCDPQIGGAWHIGSLEEIASMRRAFSSVMEHVVHADIFVVTLGLIECWFDTQSGLYLNGAPPLSVCRRHPGRFEFRVLDYDEVVKYLEEIWSLVKLNSKPGIRMMLAVSPVALLSTFRDQDVLVANAYSKAVQRAAAERFATLHDDVDYFPTLETVALTDPKIAWKPKDYRHVAPNLVRRLMTQVMKNYIGEEAHSVNLHDLPLLYKQRKYSHIVELAKKVDIGSLPEKYIYIIGLAHKRAGDIARAITYFEKVVALNPEHNGARSNLLKYKGEELVSDA